MSYVRLVRRKYISLSEVQHLIRIVDGKLYNNMHSVYSVNNARY